MYYVGNTELSNGCEDCDAEFKRKSYLNIHKNNVHKSFRSSCQQKTCSKFDFDTLVTSGKISLTAHKIKRMVKQKKVEVEAKEPHMKVTKTEDKTDSNKKDNFQLMKNLTCLSIVEDYQEP